MSSRFNAFSPLFLAATFLAIAASSLPGAAASAQEWTRFRGPNGSGLATGPEIPSRWTELEQNWRVELPGEGHSQPVEWGGRLFLTGAAEGGNRRIAFCLRAADGDLVWEKSWETDAQAKHNFSSYASHSAAVDAERVYFVFGTSKAGWLTAFSHAGEEKWTKDLGPYQTRHAAGSSPVVFQGRVLVAKDVQNESYLAAFDAASGDQLWRLDRESSHTSYGTPCVYTPPEGNPRALYTSHKRGFTAVDVMTGAVVWEAKVFDKRTVSSPLLGAGLVIGTTGSGGGGNYLVAVHLGGTGDVTESKLAYKIRRSAPYVPTPIVKGKFLFLWSDKGIVSCVDAASGEIHWQERVGGRYFGSPVCIDDRLFCVTHEGEVVVVSATGTFELLGRTPLGEESHSTPAVASGKLYVRTLKHLVSVGGRRVAKR